MLSDQALQPFAVDLVCTAEIVYDLRLGSLGGGEIGYLVCLGFFRIPQDSARPERTETPGNQPLTAGPQTQMCLVHSVIDFAVNL
jgi:hypothetical protein